MLRCVCVRALGDLRVLSWRSILRLVSFGPKGAECPLMDTVWSWSMKAGLITEDSEGRQRSDVTTTRRG